jgi:hypothetical protein
MSDEQRKDETMNIEPIKLRRGSGNGNPNDGLCLMQAVHWFSGADELSDNPECASPALCAIGIRLNDSAPSQGHRDQLWPLVWSLLDSRDPEAEQRRAEYIVREIVHRIVAPVFDRFAPHHGAALRAANTMSEIHTAAAGAAEAARGAAAAADAAAGAAAWATAATGAAARAAARGAAAWATAAAGAAAAADAAAGAAARATAATGAAAAKEIWWDELRSIFVEAIALGKHGEADPIYAPRAMQLVRILETDGLYSGEWKHHSLANQHG